MFNLDRAIADWRQELAQTGLDGDDLNELESHLRDDLDVHLRSGLDPGEAFDVAARRVGDARTLKHEFATSVSAADHLKSLLFTLAGIPNQTLATTMNTTRFEPAWVTYLKAATFALPGICLAILSAVFVVPKLQQICADAGLANSAAGVFWNLTYSSIQVMLGIFRHGALIGGAMIMLLLLLEWRFAQWPRYRRAAVGCGAFVLNSLVLFALFMMFFAAIVAAPGLSR
jgi:hypothetical protein